MLVLITYDVSTVDAAGRSRLRRVAKRCTDFGQRVQNSVFECLLNEAQFRTLQHELSQLIDKEKDSLRFYNLGNNYQTRIEHIGVKQSYPPEGVLMV
jgi:CRISPR-associated protein Cas2